jgi:hypothetical protein
MKVLAVLALDVLTSALLTVPHARSFGFRTSQRFFCVKVSFRDVMERQRKAPFGRLPWHTHFGALLIFRDAKRFGYSGYAR